jgi:hypothetical protein
LRILLIRFYPVILSIYGFLCGFCGEKSLSCFDRFSGQEKSGIAAGILNLRIVPGAHQEALKVNPFPSGQETKKIP